jgi:hypothetical protein
MRNKTGTQKTGPNRPAKRGRSAGPVRLAQGARAVDRPQFFPRMYLFDFLLWSKNFKGSLKKENAFSRVFLFGLFNWPRWELGNRSHLAFSCIHATAMTSPNSVELKLGAKEPSMEEGSDVSSRYSWRSRGPPAFVAEGVSRPERLHLTTPSKRRRSLLPFEGRHTSEA